MAAHRIWIKNPRPVHRQRPASPGRAGGRERRHRRNARCRGLAFAAGGRDLRRPRTRGAAGAGQHPSPLPDPHPRVGAGGQRATVQLAADPLPGLGAADAAGAAAGEQGGAGRAAVVRLHHGGGSPLPVSGRARGRHRHPGRGRPRTGHACHAHPRFDEPVQGKRRPAMQERGAGRRGHPRRQRAADRPLPRARRRRADPDRLGALLAVLGHHRHHADLRGAGRSAGCVCIPTAETLDEQEFCAKRFGMRTVDYLQSVGWLGPRTGWPMASISTGNSPPGCSRCGHLPLPEFQHASGLRHLPHARARGQGRHHRPGRGRFGLQRRLQHDARSASGAVHPAPALRRRRSPRRRCSAGRPAAPRACSGAATSASWRSASRPIWPCSSSTNCAFPAATIPSPRCCFAPPTVPTG